MPQMPDFSGLKIAAPTLHPMCVSAQGGSLAQHTGVAARIRPPFGRRRQQIPWIFGAASGLLRQ